MKQKQGKDALLGTSETSSLRGDGQTTALKMHEQSRSTPITGPGSSAMAVRSSESLAAGGKEPAGATETGHHQLPWSHSNTQP